MHALLFLPNANVPLGQFTHDADANPEENCPDRHDLQIDPSSSEYHPKVKYHKTKIDVTYKCRINQPGLQGVQAVSPILGCSYPTEH